MSHHSRPAQETITDSEYWFPDPAKKAVITQYLRLGEEPPCLAWLVVAVFYDKDDVPVWSIERFVTSLDSDSTATANLDPGTSDHPWNTSFHSDGHIEAASIFSSRHLVLDIHAERSDDQVTDRSSLDAAAAPITYEYNEQADSLDRDTRHWSPESARGDNDYVRTADIIDTSELAVIRQDNPVAFAHSFRAEPSAWNSYFTSPSAPAWPSAQSIYHAYGTSRDTLPTYYPGLSRRY
ncbi:hypothetical protein S40293_05561 [Stachybotrys chartarum IBT 40293]|nr:hypothetical protein S40293_05561 [Stachybotrys chartarum IBT 40293]